MRGGGFLTIHLCLGIPAKTKNRWIHVSMLNIKWGEGCVSPQVSLFL